MEPSRQRRIIEGTIGFRNRANVLVNWAWNYLTYDRGSRVIVEPDVESDP